MASYACRVCRSRWSFRPNFSCNSPAVYRSHSDSLFFFVAYATNHRRINRTGFPLVGTIDDDMASSCLKNVSSMAVLRGEIPRGIIMPSQYPHVAFAQIFGKGSIDFAEETRSWRSIKINENNTSFLLLETFSPWKQRQRRSAILLPEVSEGRKWDSSSRRSG